MLLARWERSQDHHYAVWGLRWSAGQLAGAGRLDLARACTEALASIAASAGYADALAALACAIAETALAEGDADAAAPQFARAAELHALAEHPVRARADPHARRCRADRDRRARGRRRPAVRGAPDRGRRSAPARWPPRRRRQVAALGASVLDRLGRRAAAEQETAGLSRREVEVVRLVAQGLTNREIAAGLVLSTRTVDMHVRNILTKLRSHTRTEAAARAGELGLLGNLPTDVRDPTGMLYS